MSLSQQIDRDLRNRADPPSERDIKEKFVDYVG